MNELPPLAELCTDPIATKTTLCASYRFSQAVRELGYQLALALRLYPILDWLVTRLPANADDKRHDEPPESASGRGT